MKRITRTKAIREKCLDCMCWNAAEVRRCPSTDCTLWPYRLGREVLDLYDEDVKREITAQREAASKRAVVNGGFSPNRAAGEEGKD